MLYKRFSPAAKTASILLYHRISDDPIDVWDLTVLPEIFNRQLQWLKSNCSVISLEEMVWNWKRMKLKSTSVAITFDDGYLDNYTVAQHLLNQYSLPATFFITNQTESLWWDELEACLLKTEILPEGFHLNIGSFVIDYSLLNETLLTNDLQKKLEKWKATDIPTTKRAGLLMVVWKQLRYLDHESRQKVMSYIKEWSSSQIEVPALMSKPQVKDLGNLSLVEIGAHTCTHPVLSSLESDAQKTEMLKNKNYLEELTGKTVNHISYPYGDFDEQTAIVAGQSGFKAGFTTQAMPVGFCKNIYQLSRFCVTNKNLSDIIKKKILVSL